MLFSIYTRLDASSPLRSGCVSGSWLGTHHYPIACLGVLSTIGGRCRLHALGSCSLRALRMFFLRRGALLGFSFGVQLANGPTAHPPTIAPPPESGAWMCVRRHYCGFERVG
ncbi:hypothetical protein DY000_02046824 [Brassica cretica]|uniref:Uncharacterized protein n=1 Tax=Brassica cretica TaxID=69181 RepID=A0ABQ7EXB5_BRACR|nr:hypothetical protein DY000_02046824 [Brassica cretica]